MEVYLAASGASAKDGKVQTAIIFFSMITSRGKVMMINISPIKYWKP